ncbi:TonB-dependent receptor plug domain-containing protein [Photobacterium nomapromontoriensis]|uniref:TonB-dependent receptor plug domain-containing protein n=1 Tax=Photobacterium nomapromontoriensis TaxID=2910237 RepID=UPI003D0C9360
MSFPVCHHSKRSPLGQQIAILLLFTCATTQASVDELERLMSMSLDELSNADISVTSVAKKNQSINEIPAAVYVITNEQIRRSGVRSVAEALSLAPGLQVTRISEFNWQVSLRGLNEVLFNKLLIMIDGRSVYSPLMSGTFWHTVDTVFEDIARIEVIQGTAGTMWGGNAANGVVNIITKNSRDTLGHYTEVAYGERDYQEINYRYGARINDRLTARAFIKGVNADYYLGQDDNWRNLRGGIRADYEETHRQVTFQVGGYQTRSEHYWYYMNFYSDPANVFNETDINIYARGAYVSIDWFEQHHDTQYELHMWMDTNSTNEPSAAGEFYTFDIDTLAHTSLNHQHELTVGGGVRVIHRRTEPYPDNFYSYVEPWGRYSRDPKGTDIIVNGYAQLESQLSDKLTSTLGGKIEYFSLNDTVEFQPQARLLYRYNDEQQFWAGAGRAVVTPSFVDTKTDAYFLGTVTIIDKPTGLPIDSKPTVVYTTANQELKNESVTTVDMGHRYTPSSSLNIDSTLFYSQYKNLRMEGNSEWGCIYGQCNDGSTLPLEMFALIENYSDALDADTYGFETAIRWTPFDTVMINTSYSYIRTDATCSGHVSCDTTSPSGYKTKYNNQPAHLVSLQSLWSFAPGWQLDLWYKHKSAVTSESTYFDAPSISTIDMRLAWQQQQNWPRVELIIDAIDKDDYQDLTDKAYIDETVFLRASWNIQ